MKTINKHYRDASSFFEALEKYQKDESVPNQPTINFGTLCKFKDEVGEIMEQMLENAANKKEILSDLIAKESPTASNSDDNIDNKLESSQSAATSKEGARETSAWEKKLEQLG